MSRPLAQRVALSLFILAIALGVALSVGGENPLRLAASIPLPVYAGVLFFLLLNAVAAAARFSFIASQLSGAIGFRESIAIVSAGSLGGAIFSLVGQVVARAATMARHQSGSFANAVLVTTYEKASAATVSALGAVVGAYIVFGQLGIDWPASVPMVKLAIVGALALASGIALSGLWRSLLPQVNLESAAIFSVALLCSVAVQIPTMAAYMIVAYALAPDTSLVALFGATLIVMFAASVPISFAGWGVRELSAVAALGAVGVDPAQAVLAAVVIGAGSMLTAGMFAAVTIPQGGNAAPKPERTRPAHDNTALLTLAVPLLAAIAVPFQVYLPVASSVVNVNLADPLAIVGGALFVLRYVSGRRWPVMRYRLVWPSLAMMTLVLTVALLIGFVGFGVTTWAVMNRFAGWGILLAYVMTGALVYSEHGHKGLTQVAGAFVGSMVAVAGVELFLVAAGYFISLPAGLVELSAIKGLAQNRNAFAFQLIMALAVTLALFERRDFVLPVVGILSGTIMLTFSRSGIGTAAILLLLVAAINPGYRRWLIVVAVAAAALAVTIYTISGPYYVMDRLTAMAAANFAERMQTLTGGLRLFLDNPLFGAGVGAYRFEGHPASNGEPLVIHSTYIWLLAETGALGFLCFVAPAAALFVAEFRRLRTDRIAVALVLCLAIAGIMGLPADMLYQRTFWIILGALLAVPRSIAPR